MSAHQIALASFLDQVHGDECIDAISRHSGVDRQVTVKIMRDYAGEVPVALSLLDNIDLTGKRILDVGAGVGLASFYLTTRGFDVTALEPGGIGFEVNHRLFLAIRDHLGLAERVPLLSIGAESLSPAEHGHFDVQFSANVLEHVPDLPSVVRALAGCLAAGGISVHTCPNYTVPYEPHYGLPLLPAIPAATPWARSRQSEPLWKSFNFITARQVLRLLRNAGLEPVLTKGMMSKAFDRLLVDPVFAGRQGPTLVRAAKFMKRTGLLALLRAWPPLFATPMIVTATRPESRAPNAR